MAVHEAGTGTTVLLLESEPGVRTGVAASLLQAGFNIIEAESPAEAWATLERRSDVRVVFADLDGTTGADGLEFARQVHARWPSLGLVITSAVFAQTRCPATAAFCPVRFRQTRCCTRSRPPPTRDYR